MQTARQNFHVQKWITVLAVALFALKIWAWIQTNSLLVLSDALESIVNVVAGFIGLYSLYVAAKPEDRNHPYGHGKAEFVSSAVEGALITAAGVLIIFQTLINFESHKPLQQLEQGTGLITFTALLNGISGWYARRRGKQTGSRALTASGTHLLTDTYSTGAVIAGLLLVQYTGAAWIDKILAVGIGSYIILSGYKIIRQSMAGIMDEADMTLLEKLIRLLNTQRRENWIDLHNLRIIQYGTRMHVDAHLTLPYYLNLQEAHQEIDLMNEKIEKVLGSNLEMFIHTDGCVPLSCPICAKSDCPVRQHSFVQKLDWTTENTLLNARHQV